jgi:glycosyltransferase involved in cell wall biosynthesis
MPAIFFKVCHNDCKRAFCPSQVQYNTPEIAICPKFDNPLGISKKKPGMANKLCLFPAADAMKKPLISVIIPVFNRAGQVREAAESVLNQDFNNFELIVVDDGSTDSTAKDMEKYLAGFPRAKLVSTANCGVSAARNLGVSLACGKFVAFLDSDDLWLSQKLRAQKDFFAQNPSAAACQTQEIWIRNGRRVNPKNRHAKPDGEIFLPSLSLCLVSPSAVMIKKDAFLSLGGFDERLPACEDYDLWLRLGLKYKVFLLDKALVIKRGGHPDQLSAQPGLDCYRIASLINLLEYQNLNPQQRARARDVLLEKITVYAAGCEKRKKLDEAFFYRKVARRYSNEV